MSRSKKVSDTCHLCGEYKKLSKEHIPPEKAFNNFTFFKRSIDKEQSTSELKWKEKPQQGGNFEYVLCGKCNNDTGSWYADDYIKFTQQLADYAHESNVNKRGSVSLETIYPVRIAKQMLIIFAASCGPKFINQHEGLRRLILNKHNRWSIHPLRMYLYLRCHMGGRTTGITGVLDTEKGNSKVIAEFSWWPLGLVLSFNDNPLDHLTDVSNWFSFNYDESTNLLFEMPCLPAATAYPLDFRSQEKVENEAENNQ